MSCRNADGKKEQRYHSYLLRLWRTGSGANAVWRASLESPRTGKHQGFAGLKDLFAFLEAQAGVETLGTDAENGFADDQVL